MKLLRRGTRVLGAGRVRMHCEGGPLDGDLVVVPEDTREFFSVEPVDTALDPNDLLPIWRYELHGSRLSGCVFRGVRHTDI